jgi:hypothetical protein
VSAVSLRAVDDFESDAMPARLKQCNCRADNRVQAFRVFSKTLKEAIACPPDNQIPAESRVSQSRRIVRHKASEVDAISQERSRWRHLGELAIERKEPGGGDSIAHPEASE